MPPPVWQDGAAVAVVMASAGYPESSRSGDAITGLDAAEALDDVHVIQAGTALDGDDLVTAGGRVLAVIGDRRRTSPPPAPRRTRAWPSSTSRAPSTARTSRRASEPATVSDLPPGPMRENGAVTVPNVLATRYAAADLAEIWSPEHKIVLERQLWIAVLRAQRDLGIDVPDGVVEAYEDVVDKVDLASIAARERITRHDVKARIEEFSALAGHEHIHKGMTSRDLTENVEQLQVKQSLDAAARPRPSPRSPAWPGCAAEHETTVMAGRSHNVAAQATTLGKRFATVADEMLIALERVEELLARYPLRGIKGPMGTAQDMLDLLDGDADQLAELEQRVAAHLGFDRVLDQRRPGLPALARLRRALRARPAGRRAVQPGHHDPADGRQRARHRGLQGGPGRLVGDAAQDEHPLLRARQRPRRASPAATSRWSASSPATSGTRATSPAPSYAGWRCPTRSSPPTGSSRPSSPCSTSSAPSRR